MISSAIAIYDGFAKGVKSSIDLMPRYSRSRENDEKCGWTEELLTRTIFSGLGIIKEHFNMNIWSFP